MQFATNPIYETFADQIAANPFQTLFALLGAAVIAAMLSTFLRG